MWGYDCYFSNLSTQSRGVAIFINNNFEFKCINCERDQSGNLLILNSKIMNHEITLICIYGPNRDDPEFFKHIKDKILHLNSPCIVVGDFNLVLNPNIDYYNYLNINNIKARDIVLEMMLECNLIDCWREQNIEERKYTWFRRNPTKKARLDFFLTSDTLFTDLTDCKIESGYRTDHSLISLDIQFGKFKKGNSYWKFNNSLLKDKEYVTHIKTLINEVIQQYSCNIQNSRESLENVQKEIIKFNINDKLFFETLLIEIRGKTIWYSSYKKKQEDKRQETLTAQITSLENQPNTDETILDNKKQELLELRNKKMQGVLMRSRAKWIAEGEKPSKYFCSMENRNYVSKIMNSLNSSTGELLTNQQEILDEVTNHYKNLYALRDTVHFDSHSTRFNNIPKLNKNDKHMLGSHLTYSEMLSSLKNMSNDSSPGSSGFTAAFLKFFWNDIGYFLLRSINHAFDTGEL